MRRKALLDLLENALGARQLVWFGTRGDDAAGLEDLEQLAAVFSVVSRYDRRPDVASAALEDHTGVRVDLDDHDVDDDPHLPALDNLRGELLAVLSHPSVVATYRPSTFLNGVTFARQQTCDHLGMFKEHQFAFEHKPWVEAAAAGLGIPRLQWTYLSDRDVGKAQHMLRAGPVVLRRSHSSGGTGVIRVDSMDDLVHEWPREPGGFVAVAPFLDDTVPVNIGAVAWDDGTTVHWPSVQLIGIRELTHREFGFCGNDFSLARDLEKRTLEQMERSTRAMGDWLRGLGYRGAFGIDFLVKDGVPVFTEVNARFQGSSHASSIVSRERAESCIFLDHLAAHLQLPRYEQPPLVDRIQEMPALAHLVLHWSGPSSSGPGGAEMVQPLAALGSFQHADVLLPSRMSRDVGAPVYRAILRRGVTRTGFTLDDDVAAAVRLADHTRKQGGETPWRG